MEKIRPGADKVVEQLKSRWQKYSERSAAAKSLHFQMPFYFTLPFGLHDRAKCTFPLEVLWVVVVFGPCPCVFL